MAIVPWWACVFSVHVLSMACAGGVLHAGTGLETSLPHSRVSSII